MNFIKALGNRAIALLWVGQVLSSMGDYFYQIAVMWIAVKQAGSGAGLVAAAETGSLLIFGLLGGVFADRWNRRYVMLTVDCIRAVTVAILPLLAFFGRLQLWHLVIAAIIIGSLGALFNPALQASLPSLSGDVKTLQATNGLMDVTSRIALAIGPSLAGVLIVFLPLPHFFTLDAISFAISALAIFFLGRNFVWRPDQSVHKTTGLASILHEIRDAIQLVHSHRALAWAIVSNGILNIVWGAAFIVGVPLFVDRTLTGNVGAYGLIVGAYGVGNVLSNLVIGSITIQRRTLSIFLGNIILGAGFLILALAHNLPLAMIGTAVAALGGPMEDISMAIMMQTELPASELGKVYSLRMVLSSVGGALGLSLAVPFFAHLSIGVGIGLCALTMIACGIAGVVRFGVSEPEIVITH
ncbi:MFS transporter [Tengunoibacter tsumagoiensis]|uniref:MFS transporter n=1 Tax=Tengunoibacter tsumagoiensis TaxID=2014871 RepID=A0A401ZTI8_9CHLR|nr:MFS transporter [Tengunoibacter tsumagoiensis]GCE10228.1 MFS transporter [Tengunoibacter tsumagoiensis]